MKGKFKLLTALIATFCAALTCGVFAACNPDDESTEIKGDPAKDGYVVTLLFPDGTPVKNTDGDSQFSRPGVELTDAEGNLIDPSAYSVVNASGIAQISYFVPGEYFINPVDYPSGYTFDENSVKTSTDRAYYTISLKLAPPTTYKINLKYPDGTAMKNVTVKLMDGETKVAEATTDDNGVAITPQIKRGVYSVVLENLPIGYRYREVSTTIAAWDVNITTLGATNIKFDGKDGGKKLEGDELKLWDETLNSTLLTRFNKTGDNYIYNAEFRAGEEVFFTIHAPKSGEYTIGSKAGNDYVIQFYHEDLSSVDASLTIDSDTNSGNNVQKMHIEKDETLSFSVKSFSRKAGSVEVLVGMPVPAAQTVTATAEGNYTLTFTDFNTAILKFVTSTTAGKGFGQGVYEITSKSDDYDLMIVEYVNSYPSLDENSDLTGDYAGFAGNDNGADDGRNFKFNFSLTQSYVGATLDLHVIIKGATITNTVQVDVNVKRLGDAEDEKQVEKKTATATATAKYENQSGTFTWMPTNGSIEPYQKGGKWYVDVDGVEKALVVAITKNIRSQEYSFATIEYLADGQTHKDRVNSYLTVFEDMTTQDTTWNYTGFIETYKELVNDDGVYEVNDELQLFLQRYMNQRYHNVTGSSTKPAYPWLLGCGYYA